MEWIKVIKREDRKVNYYLYLSDDSKEKELIFEKGKKVTCRLSDGQIKDLILDYNLFDVTWTEEGIPYHVIGGTKEWFVKDGKNEYKIEEIDVLINEDSNF